MSSSSSSSSKDTKSDDSNPALSCLVLVRISSQRLVLATLAVALTMAILTTLSISGQVVKSQSNIDVGSQHAHAPPSIPAKSCYRHNTPEWLYGHRLGNVQDPLFDDNFIRQNIVDFSLDTAFPILDQSICYDESRFVSTKEYEQDETSVRLWAVRLAYLAMHYHQHLPAREEALARLDNTCSTDLNSTAMSVGKMDYECKDSKFIVIGLADIGLGANMRIGVSVFLISAFVTNRVVVLINNAPVNDKYLQKPWLLTSCDRLDAQCFFMPLTPCVLTVEDINNGHELSNAEQRKLFKKGETPPGHDDTKVWYTRMMNSPVYWIPPVARERMHNYANVFIGSLSPSDPRIPVLKLAAESLTAQDPDRPNYAYTGAYFKTHHAMTFYAMRPNPSSAKKLDKVMSEIVPPGVDTENVFGLPVRASDKCLHESECLSFHQHMQIVEYFWKKFKTENSLPDSDPTIVFTTESTDMVAAQKAFEQNTTAQADLSHKYTFLTNDQDVTPDSGFVTDATKKGNITADDALISSIASLKLQLQARVSIGNCCSNFHILLADFLREGCGVAPKQDFWCMQEIEDKSLMVCCGWHHDCKAEKHNYTVSMNADGTVVAT